MLVVRNIVSCSMGVFAEVLNCNIDCDKVILCHCWCSSCAEFFSQLINFEEFFGQLNGIKVGRGSPTVSHLLYMDDILVTCQASTGGVEVMKRVFDCFGKWSRLKVNGGKSCIFFSSKTYKRLKVQIKRVLGIKEMKQ